VYPDAAVPRNLQKYNIDIPPYVISQYASADEKLFSWKRKEDESLNVFSKYLGIEASSIAFLLLF
jgi:hypothetical protein